MTLTNTMFQSRIRESADRTPGTFTPELLSARLMFQSRIRESADRTDSPMSPKRSAPVLSFQSRIRESADRTICACTVNSGHPTSFNRASANQLTGPWQVDEILLFLC